MADQPKGRFVLLALAGLVLLAALWGGVARLGWDLPVPNEELPSLHGPLMVVGFLGTLIGLERAVALARIWPYGAPLFAGLGALSALAGLPISVGASLAVTGSFLLTLVFISLYRQSPGAHFVVMGLGSVAWLVGNCLWLAGSPLYLAVVWWTGFLVLMIAGERLQLSRVMQRSRRVLLIFHLSTAMALAGLIVALFEFQAGVRVAGIAWLMLGLWLLRYDIAWRTLQEANLPRYMAICLLSGYVWLCVGGLLWLVFNRFSSAGLSYDAMLHSIFLGFVFSMIFAHAPVIFPSITGVALPFRQLFYAHLVLLHLSLLLRVGGDVALWIPARRWGGLLNILAVMVFVINNMSAAKMATALSVKGREGN